MHIIVVGGGIIGATTAHACLRHGHEVTLLEAGDALAGGTSFANGGQIAVSESAPWSQPGLPMKMLARSWRADAPFRLRLRADPAQWRWLLAFLANSRARAHHAGRMRNLALARYSLACLQRTRAELGNDFAYDDAQKGILQLVPAGANIDLDHIRDQTARGVPVSWLGPEEIAATEPALTAAVKNGLFAGGVWGKADESGDARVFTQRLVDTFARARFVCHQNMPVTQIIRKDKQVRGVMSAERRFEAEAVIVAAGVKSRDLLAPLGVKLPIYGVKGYSITMPLDKGAPAPEISLTDLKNRLVVSRLGARLRVAGFAEIGARPDIASVRVAAMRARVGELFPDLTLPDNVSPWVGFRPMTPDGAPLIGPVPNVAGLYVNSGHGPLGWTFSHGAAQIVADLASGITPALDIEGLSVTRAMARIFSRRGAA